MDIDFFVKVDTTNQGGQEVVVGVDKDGPLGVRQYQTTTFIPSGQEWVGSDPLPPIDRTALMALKWWKNSFADDSTIQAFKVSYLFKIRISDPSTNTTGLGSRFHNPHCYPPGCPEERDQDQISSHAQCTKRIARSRHH